MKKSRGKVPHAPDGALCAREERKRSAKDEAVGGAAAADDEDVASNAEPTVNRRR